MLPFRDNVKFKAEECLLKRIGEGVVDPEILSLWSGQDLGPDRQEKAGPAAVG